LDSSGQSQALQAPPGIYENPRFSPDGKRLIFELAAGPVQADIWMKDLKRDTMSRVTHLPGRSNHPVWTPDGKGVVFVASYLDAPGIYWMRADGTGEAQLLMRAQGLLLGSFSPDGKQLAYTQTYPDRRAEIWTAPLEGDSEHPRLGKPEPFLRTPFLEMYPEFSPDGHWLAYASNDSGTYELHVRAFPGPGDDVPISTGGGSFPVWSRKQHQLFFQAMDGRIMVLDYAVNGGSFVPGNPRLWCPKSLEFSAASRYDLAPDGKRFVVLLNTAAAEQEQKRTESVVVLLNFFDELRRRTQGVRATGEK
jgi:serine/threonine-protein kinase